MTATDDFFGRGISHPLRVGGTGGIVQSAGSAKVEESIRVILGTQYGERVMRPNFGSNLKSLIFAPNNTTTAHLARFYVEEGLKLWEPRIDVIEVTADSDLARGRLLIQILYRLRATHDIRSMVYPFYLDNQEQP
jgi:phage baseplate assembly protein W